MGNHVKIVGNHLDQEIVIHLLVLIINHRILVILLLFLWVVVLLCPMLNVLLQDHRNWAGYYVGLSRTRHGSFLFDTELCPVCGGLGRVFTAPPPPLHQCLRLLICHNINHNIRIMDQKDKHGENNMLNSFKIFKNTKTKI